MNQATEHRTESSAQSAKPPSTRKAPEEEIRFRAYQIYLSRNRTPGHALEDWIQAERELLPRN
jgi:Protein of unknown function (DUF2934)